MMDAIVNKKEHRSEDALERRAENRRASSTLQNHRGKRASVSFSYGEVQALVLAFRELRVSAGASDSLVIVRGLIRDRHYLNAERKLLRTRDRMVERRHG